MQGEGRGFNERLDSIDRRLQVISDTLFDIRVDQEAFRMAFLPQDTINLVYPLVRERAYISLLANRNQNSFREGRDQPLEQQPGRTYEENGIDWYEPAPDWLVNLARIQRPLGQNERVLIYHYDRSPNCLPSALAHATNYEGGSQAVRIAVRDFIIGGDRAGGSMRQLIRNLLGNEPQQHANDFAGDNATEMSFAICFGQIARRSIRVYFDPQVMTFPTNNDQNPIELMFDNVHSTYYLVRRQNVQ